MSIKPASAKAKGSRLERDSAAILGGKRAPLSGALGGGDLWLSRRSLFADSFIFEAKQRAKLPHLLTRAMTQAEVECRSGKRPAVIYREDGNKRAMVAFYLEDIVNFAQALAEVGNGRAIRDHLERIMRLAEEAKRLAS